MTDQPVAQAPQAAPVDGQPAGEGPGVDLFFSMIFRKLKFKTL